MYSEIRQQSLSLAPVSETTQRWKEEDEVLDEVLDGMVRVIPRVHRLFESEPVE